MATAKTATEHPFLDDYGLDDEDKGLANQFTDHLLYDGAISPELQAIIDDPVKYQQWLVDVGMEGMTLEL